MKAPNMVNIKNYIPENMPVIRPAANSPKGLFVPAIVSEYGQISGFLKVMGFIFPNILKTLLNIRRSYKSIVQNAALKEKTISDDTLKDFESYARRLGCSQIGYTRVPREYIFSNKVILFENAIVLTMDMRKTRMKKAPSVKTSMEVWRAYAGLGEIVNRLASYLRQLGFQAQAGPALGGETNYPYLAQKAGLGHIGKHGLLISEGNGPSQRIAAIYTNIENLPFSDSDRYSWIPDFCTKCKRCVRACPAQAIYDENVILENGYPRHIDYKKCAVPFSTTAGCSVCIKECTFFKGDFEKIKASFFKRK